MGSRFKICPKCKTRFPEDAVFCPLDGCRLQSALDPLVGRTIAGRYLVEEKVGSGGMGTVYRCRHQVIGRDVALKFLLPAFSRDKKYRHRFLGEARVANQINHEHIIDITDFGETEDGFVYLVMEYLDGRPLSRDIADGPMPRRRVVHIGRQIAQGLGRAHELGVVHRDIKPDNVYLVENRGDPDFIKLLDFGVARFAQDMRVTAKGAVVGTPEYMSPEQVRSREITASTDLYSLGCVLFEMLTRRLPFTGSQAARIVKQMSEPAPPPSSLLPSIPPEVDAVVLRLLQRKPEDRYRDAYHLLDDLNLLLDVLPAEAEAVAVHRAPATVAGGERTICAAAEEEGWLERVRLYRRLLQDKYAGGGAPAWLLESIGQIESALDEALLVRQKLSNAVKTATEQEEDVRELRLRIGNALDELARDESRVSRELDAARGELAVAISTMESSEEELLGEVETVPEMAAGVRALPDPEVAALDRLVRAARRLAKHKRTVTHLKGMLDTKQSTWDDLQFQIGQLKGRLGTLNAASNMDKDSIHDRTLTLETQLRLKLESIIPHAQRISSHFMSYPDLRPLLEQETA